MYIKYAIKYKIMNVNNLTKIAEQKQRGVDNLTKIAEQNQHGVYNVLGPLEECFFTAFKNILENAANILQLIQ